MGICSALWEKIPTKQEQIIKTQKARCLKNAEFSIFSPHASVLFLGEQRYRYLVASELIIIFSLIKN